MDRELALLDEQKHRCYRATQSFVVETLRETMRSAPCLPGFSVVVWLRETNKFAALKSELLAAAETEPYESTRYQGMVDFHWATASLPDAKRLAEALTNAARHPELVLLKIMSRVDGADSLCIKDTRRTKH